jgi:O-antigen/teichoic acid export membrane protein
MTLADRLASGTKAVFGGNLVGMVSQAGLVLVLTRVFLTPDEYGELNFALSAFGVVVILATLGLPKSAARYVTEFAERDPGQVPHVVRASVGYLCALVAVVAGATLLFGGPLARFAGTPSLVPFVGLGAAWVAARAFTSYFGALFQGFNRVQWSAKLRVVTRLGQLLFVVAFVALGFGVAGALAGYVAGLGVAAVVGGVVAYTKFYRAYEPAAERAEGLSRRLLEYSVPLTATRGANVLDKKVDTIIVGVFTGMAGVGFYTVAKQVSNFASMPAASFGFTLSPALGEQANRENGERAARLYEQSLSYVLLAYVPAAVGLVLVADPMVRYVFGSDYLGAVPVVRVFAGFVLVNAVNKITTDALDYLGRARERAVVKGASAVANVLLNLLLVPLYGAVGAAVATVVTYTAYTLANVYVIHDELGLRVGRVGRRIGLACLVSLGMASAVVLVLPYVSGVVSLLAAVGLGAGIWGLLAVASGAVDPAAVRRFVA